MKSILKVNNICSIADVNNIRQAVSNNQGVVACQISLEKNEVNVVFDDFFINEDKIIESIEDVGYTVINLIGR